MNAEELYLKLINELNLVENKRMAVYYWDTVGDAYSLYAAIQYAEIKLQKEYIVLYWSDIHQEMINWFSYDNYYIKSHKMSKNEIECFCRVDLEIRKKYKGYFISWMTGDDEFRDITRNVGSKFGEVLRSPRFPKQNILEKYSEYIIPKKTILILPETNTISSPPAWFWNLAAQFYRYLDYSVVFNVPNEKSNIYDGACLFLPLSETVEFADECGYVFGVRSGLFDVLRTSTAKMVIFSTKSYKPLNEVFNIPNEPKRIKTIYYEDFDPFFKKSIINEAENYYEQVNRGTKKLLFELCRTLSDESGIANIKTAKAEKTYCVARYCNKYLYWADHTFISPFVDVKYTNRISDDKLFFSVFDISPQEYRFDYEIRMNDRIIMSINDMKSNCLVCPLKQTGEYCVKVKITDLKNYNQEHFETERLFYSAPIPVSPYNLAFCEDFYSYVIALERYSSQLIVLISSRDAHTFFKKNKNTETLHIMRLLNLKTDFEETCRYSYIGVIDSGKVLKELLSENKTLTYRDRIDGNDIVIESSGFNVNHSDKTPIKIEINGVNEAVDKRGLNFAVWDKLTNKLLDSVCFDTFLDGRAIRKDK